MSSPPSLPVKPAKIRLHDNLPVHDWPPLPLEDPVMWIRATARAHCSIWNPGHLHRAKAHWDLGLFLLGPMVGQLLFALRSSDFSLSFISSPTTTYLLVHLPIQDHTQERQKSLSLDFFPTHYITHTHQTRCLSPKVRTLSTRTASCRSQIAVAVRRSFFLCAIDLRDDAAFDRACIPRLY